MGSNLALNIEEKGWPCVTYERESEALDKFISENKDKKFTKADTLVSLVSQLEGPRVILMMIKAGAPVDTVIEKLIPLLNKDDILIEGGNSFYQDTERRIAKLKDKGIRYIGMGVSGGEEGARHGPSLMPGGSKEAWGVVRPTLEAIAAKHEAPCVDYIGAGGSGHFVKMVHNGIEYAIMQLLAEAYDLARSYSAVGEFSSKLAEWNAGRLESYLVGVTEKVLKKEDADTGKLLLDVILDSAGQKGTGRWTAQEALELGVAVPTISASVNARILSSRKAERIELSGKYPQNSTGEIPSNFFEALEKALYASFLLSFDQGMTLMQAASNEYSWSLDRSKVSSVWREGCILRSKMLEGFIRVYKQTPDITCLLYDNTIGKEIVSSIFSLKQIVMLAVEQGVPNLAFSSALSYLESLLTEKLPQSLTQGQRDFFGAHTYKRLDKEGVFHTDWEE